MDIFKYKVAYNFEMEATGALAIRIINDDPKKLGGRGAIKMFFN